MSTSDRPAVLVVDDNEATCTLVRAILQKEFRVDVVSNGKEAVAKLRPFRYAAVLLDLKMPDLDGYAVLEALKDSPEVLKRTIIFTAALTEREMRRVSEHTVYGIVRKPFEVEDLRNAVRKCAGVNSGGHAGGALLSGSILLLLESLLRR